MTRLKLLGIVLLAVGCGCGTDRPVTPTEPTPNPVVQLPPETVPPETVPPPLCATALDDRPRIEDVSAMAQGGWTLRVSASCGDIEAVSNMPWLTIQNDRWIEVDYRFNWKTTFAVAENRTETERFAVITITRLPGSEKLVRQAAHGSVGPLTPGPPPSPPVPPPSGTNGGPVQCHDVTLSIRRLSVRPFHHYDREQSFTVRTLVRISGDLGVRNGPGHPDNVPFSCTFPIVVDRPWLRVVPGSVTATEQDHIGNDGVHSHEITVFVRPNLQPRRRTGNLRVGGSTLTVAQDGYYQ